MNSRPDVWIITHDEIEDAEGYTYSVYTNPDSARRSFNYWKTKRVPGPNPDTFDSRPATVRVFKSIGVEDVTDQFK